MFKDMIPALGFATRGDLAEEEEGTGGTGAKASLDLFSLPLDDLVQLRLRDLGNVGRHMRRGHLGLDRPLA